MSGVYQRLRRLGPWAPLVLGTAILAHHAIAPVLQKLGHPGAALDDAYIHFQYARAIAEGHPLRFQAGEPISTGATSFLWPLVLSPFYLVGFRGESILWPAWALSFLAMGALAYEAYALAKPLAGRGAAIGAGAMTLAFGGLAWGAASGMEVAVFAWLIAHTSRRAVEWAEGSRRDGRALKWLIALAFALPLMRPEGALTSIAAGVTILAFPRAPSVRSRLEAAPFLVAAVFPQLLLLALTGAATTSTAQVKLLFGNPYYTLPDAAIANARTLVGQILNGDVWSAEFLPKGGSSFACVGLVATAWRGHASKRLVRAGFVLLFALSMFVPCFYVTFLWNRLRYLWPFAPGWFIGLACLGRAAGDLAARLDRRVAPAVATLIAGACAGTFVTRLDWVLEDVAQSASGIDRQQATLGRWAKEHLPADARIGVNDTGAIAYFSDRKTFDVVGLTTPTEGRYWVAGQGSRFEHYERMMKDKPSALPTHFIVYPEWMACTPLIGPMLEEATVTDSTILGGQTMRASEANWKRLGSGEQPWTKLSRIDDVLDVADLESEREHGYRLFAVREGDQTVEEANVPDDPDRGLVVDGGRTNRSHDQFVANTTGGRGIMRALVSTESATTLHIAVAGKELLVRSVEPGDWVELAFDVPKEAQSKEATVDVTAEGFFTSFHYWFGAP